jgi:broad specificity phosphatase PhoE
MRASCGLAMAACSLVTGAAGLVLRPPVIVHFVRHGQAAHNVRAEGKREAGCSHEEFIAAMKEDDELDADLTDKGREQARSAAERVRLPSVELVVCSSLSRAIETACLVFREQAGSRVPFVSYEGLREWNGYLLNGKRRPAHQLAARFPTVDFSAIPEGETSWTEILELEEQVAERGVQFLEWLAARPEREVAVVAHGGIYSTLFAHSRCEDEDGFLSPRFGNCEIRSVEMRSIDGVFRFRRLDLAIAASAVDGSEARAQATAAGS